MTHDSTTYKALAMAGTLPFVACALLPLLGIASVPYLGPLDTVVASYGLAIVCFIAGTHWGSYLSGQSPDTGNLFVRSNAVFLAAWFAYVGTSINWAIGIQVLAFLALLLIDRRLKNDGIILQQYFRIRTTATLIAVFSLVIVLAQ